MKIQLNDSNFSQELQNAKTPVLVDFYADWCGPCKMMEPILEEVEKEMEGKLAIGKVNVDESQQVSMQFGIQSIPTMIVFKDGKPVKTMVGYQDKQNLVAQITSSI